MLSIIIVNYKTPELLAECLQTVYQYTKDVDFEIIVVDNASGDHSKEYVTKSYPQVIWLQMQYNAGFARANNAGIKAAKGDTVLLLNSDTLVKSNAIGDSYKLLEHSAYAACGVQLLNADGSPQISGNTFMTGSLNNLLPVPYLGRLFRAFALAINVNKPHVANASSTEEVHWINGAYLMVKKSVIQKAGYLDEDFFLYAEEAEWCARIRRYGKLAIFGQFNVIHLQGESSGAAFSSPAKGYSNVYDKKGLQIMLSNFVRIRKQNGVGWFLFHLIIYTIDIPFVILLHFLRGVVTFKLIDWLKLAAGYTKNVFRLWGFAGHIIANRPYFYKVL